MNRDDLLEHATRFEFTNKDGQRVQVVRADRSSQPSWLVYCTHGPTHAANHHGVWKCILAKDFEAYKSEYKFEDLDEAIMVAITSESVQRQREKRLAETG